MDIKSQIYEKISKDIVLGTLKPNQKLVEKDIASEFGISRGPVRESLQKLEANSLIVYTRNAGARVASFNKQETEDLLHVRMLLECDAAKCAAINATEDDLNNIEKLLEKHTKEIEKIDDGGYVYQNNNNDFHKAIIDSSKNKYIKKILLDELYIKLQICRNQNSKIGDRGKPALDEHIKIYEAIKERNPELAELRMRQHLENSQKNIFQIIEDKTNEEGNKND